MDNSTIAVALFQLGGLMALLVVIFFTWSGYEYQAPKVLKQKDWWWFVVPVGGFFLAVIGCYIYNSSLCVVGAITVISSFLWVFRVFFIYLFLAERYRLALSRKPGAHSDEMKARFLEVFEKKYPSFFIRFKRRCDDIEYQARRERR